MEHSLLPFEAVADDWQDAVFLLNSGGTILWVNQAAASVAGRSSESLVSLKLTDILTPRSAETAETILRPGQERGSPTLVELDICRRDLSSCRLEVSVSSLNHATEGPVLVAIGRDVS